MRIRTTLGTLLVALRSNGQVQASRSMTYAAIQQLVQLPVA
jgi:hypothetical protein